MKDKIIVFQEFSLQNFGLSKLLQEKYDCDLYAIIDITDKPKNFFQQQQFVKYTKFWFFHDHILRTKKKPDLDYLANIEEKYKIDLWKIVYNDRIFYRYNFFYKFNEDEVLSILEQSCRFFEHILDEIKPDFLIVPITNSGRMHLFYEICKARGIKVLMLNASRFGYRCIISEEAEKIDYLNEKDHNPTVKRTIDELLNYLHGNDSFKETAQYSKNFLKSKKELLKAAIKFFIFYNNTNIKSHYNYYGRTKVRALIHYTSAALKRKKRISFINKNFIRKINNDEKFIFFPMITEPERGLLIAAPFYTNQLETITHIVKSLPIGYKLYVKDHPAMATRDWRPISFYKQIIALPNVTIIHHSVHPAEILQKCSLIITTGGTSGLEAAFYGKPSITLVDALYSTLNSVTLLKNIEDLPVAIRKALLQKVDIDDLNKFVDFIDKNSFKFNWTGFDEDAHNHFFYGGFLADVEISNFQMKSFLEKHNHEFELLAVEHIKKIEEHKKHRSSNT